MRNSIVFYLNGKRHCADANQAKMMLAEYLRYDQSLTGTKVVCAEGDCGACTVLRYFPTDDTSVEGKTYYSFNSCITPVAILDGSSLVTVDALSKDGELHEVQRAMVECHGSQCGFCTPGFVMALAGLAEKKICNSENSINEQEAKNVMTGNLCRCTGYDAIIDSAKNIDLSKCESLKERFYNEDQEHDLLNTISTPVEIKSDDFYFYAPTSLHAALEYIHENPDTRIIASSTDLGVVHNKRRLKLNKLLSLHLIKDLYQIEEKGHQVSLGARVTLTELRHFLKNRIPNFAKYLDIFASPQIKNIATVVGNVANASPIGDTPPALLALGTIIVLKSLDGKRELPLDEFFLDYRKTALRPGELIIGLKFDIPQKAFFKTFKNSNRKDLDISTVNFCLYASEDQKEFRLAAGGIAATPLRLKKTEEFLANNKLDSNNIYKAIEIMHSEYTPLSDVRGTSSYRRMLVENFFKRGISQMMEDRS